MTKAYSISLVFNLHLFFCSSGNLWYIWFSCFLESSGLRQIFTLTLLLLLVTVWVRSRRPAGVPILACVWCSSHDSAGVVRVWKEDHRGPVLLLSHLRKGPLSQQVGDCGCWPWSPGWHSVCQISPPKTYCPFPLKSWSKVSCQVRSFTSLTDEWDTCVTYLDVFCQEDLSLLPVCLRQYEIVDVRFLLWVLI